MGGMGCAILENLKKYKIQNVHKGSFSHFRVGFIFQIRMLPLGFYTADDTFSFKEDYLKNKSF